MGYTHYWEFVEPLSQKQYGQLITGFEKIVETAIEGGIKIEHDFGQDSFVFNGVGQNAHESFGFAIGDEGFNFCKTAQKPYDAVVTASLIHAKIILRDGIVLSSDGSGKDWQSGQVLYETVFGVTPIDVFFLNSTF